MLRRAAVVNPILITYDPRADRNPLLLENIFDVFTIFVSVLFWEDGVVYICIDLEECFCCHVVCSISLFSVF